MFSSQHLGIYIEKDRLFYVCVKRQGLGFRLYRPAGPLEAQGDIKGEATTVFRNFLNALPFHSSRKIHICLPRNRFFIRDIPLPSMPIDDVLASVQHSIRLYVHLPLESIFYDVMFIPDPHTKGWTALLIYVKREDIQPWIDIIQETGHQDSFNAIFPLSIGVCGWLSLLRCPIPCGFVISSEDQTEIGVAVSGGCRLSFLVETAYITAMREPQIIAERIGRILPESAPLYRLSESDEHSKECLKQPPSLLRDLPHIWDNPAVAALAPSFVRYQSISLNGRAIRPRIFPWWKLLMFVFVLVCFGCGFLTWKTQRLIDQQYAQLKHYKEEYNSIEQKVRPLEKRLEKLQKAKVLIEDMAAFQLEKPRLFVWINEIARLVPENTWFPRFTFSGNDMVLQGQSPEALKVLEAIRGSEQFDQVKLLGTVSRNQNNVEQFSISITPRPPGKLDPKSNERD